MLQRKATVHALRTLAHMRQFFLLVFTCTSVITHAQSAANTGSGQVEILNADVWEFDNKVNGAQHLKGNVRFKHANAFMKCDSAYLYEDQRVDAFGHVTIDQGDTLHVDADRLKYNGQNRMARLEGNVRLRDRDMELVTPALDYDMLGRRAVYSSGGTITSRSENNVLTSGAGTYFADQRRFVFSRNVRLDHPEHTIVSDTMHYVTATGVSEFFGPTTITQGASTGNPTIIRTLRGEYNTRTDRARFTKRSSVLSQNRLLEGDSLHYDRHSGLGEAWGNVAVTDSSGDMRVLGDVGRYNQHDDRSMITGHAQLVMRMGADTLFLHSDTLFTEPESQLKIAKALSTVDDRQGLRRITARRGVRFFKGDLQGVCDTLIYTDADSIILMFHRPALWSGTDQITGERIMITLRNGQAHQLFVERSALLMSVADSVHFDQVFGTTMTGYFHNNALHRLDAEGNARTVYFAREKKDGVETIIGVNRADCSRIQVGLVDGQVATVTFMEQPDAVLYPLAKAPPEELRMKGSEYRGNERPVDRQDIFRR